MPSRRDIEAGRAFVRLFMKDDMTKPLRSALRNVGAVAQTATRHLAVLGAGITGALVGAAATFAKVGSDIADMSARTGVSTNALSEFGHAANMTGAELSDVETAIKKMQDSLVQAAGGSKTANAALDSLGLTAKHLMSLKPEEQFTAIAERLAGIEDPARRTAIAIDLFGKAGTKLLPMAMNIKALTAEARQLGLSITPEQAAAADALGDAWDRLKGAFKGATLQIGAALAPHLTDLAGRLQQMLPIVTEAVRVFADLTQAFVEVNFSKSTDDMDAMSVSAEGFALSIAEITNALNQMVGRIKLAQAAWMKFQSVRTFLAKRPGDLRTPEGKERWKQQSEMIKNLDREAMRLHSEGQQLIKGDALSAVAKKFEEIRNRNRGRNFADNLMGKMFGGAGKSLMAAPSSPSTPEAPPVALAPKSAQGGGLLGLLKMAASKGGGLDMTGIMQMMRDRFSSPGAMPSLSGSHGTAPLGVTFSADAAVAAGFRGGSNPQQRSLDDIKKTNAQAVQHLQNILDAFGRFAASMVYS